MRISEASVLEIYLKNLGNSRRRWSELNRQVSSGKKLQRPSDGPVGSARVVRIRDEMSTINQYLRNISNARTRLGTAGEALNSMRNSINMVAERAAYGLTGTISQENRIAIANDIRGALEGIVQTARMTVDGKYIFSGTAIQTDPLAEDSGTFTYQGNESPLKVEIGRNMEIQVSVVGSETFIKPGTDLVNAVSTLADQLEAGDLDGARVTLENIQNAALVIDATRFRVTEGLRRAEETQKLHNDRLFQLTSEISNLEDVNMATAISQMSQAEIALRAALGAGARIHQQNLFDYLG